MIEQLFVRVVRLVRPVAPREARRTGRLQRQRIVGGPA
jgi:hypothetical protein